MNLSITSSWMKWIIFQGFLISILHGFRWDIHDNLDPMQILTLSERYMFAGDQGPLLLPQGESYIKINANVKFLMNTNQSTKIKYVIYATDYEHHTDSVGLCGESIENYPWVQNAQILTVPSAYLATTRDPFSNAVVYIYTSQINKKYLVNVESWHNVAFQVCGEESQIIRASMDGNVAFRNPYGFIPAELYGIFPFEAARTLAFICLTVYYIYLFIAHESSILLLHKAVFVVLFVALVEATVWFAAYQKINLTGTPYCCPFPSLVVGALIMQLLRQALSRCLLLIVSLGYGIVRPKLLWMEWICVAIITITYFSISTAYEVSNIVSLDIHPNRAPDSNGMMLPSMFIDILFLSWIYLALTTTIRILTEFQQTHKLAMYEKLYSTITVFSFLFIIVSFLMSLKNSGILSFPWQWEWMQQVSWEILNFSSLAVVCIICSPSDNSSRLLYASQLPTEDPDDDDEGGVQLGQTPSSSHDNDHTPQPTTTQPSSIRSLSSSSSKPRSTPSSSSRPASRSSAAAAVSSIYSLPTAEDEDDYTI